MIQIKNHARAKGIRVTVYRDKRVVVTKSKRISQAYAERFIEEKREWIEMKVAEFAQLPQKESPAGMREEYEMYKERARVLARQRLDYFNQFYGFSWNRIAIKNTTSRWGSCSKQKNLNFSYKLALLPGELADYIVIHELCHLEELNHSDNFWNLVAKTCPNYLSLRAQLRGVE